MAAQTVAWMEYLREWKMVALLVGYSVDVSVLQMVVRMVEMTDDEKAVY